jgi:Domain of unknown function (DUF4939)
MPETSPEQKANPETLTSGNSNFESAKESSALKLTEQRKSPDLQIELVKEKPYLGTKWTRTKQTELIEGGPQFKFEETNKLLAESSYWTEPRPEQPYSPIKNLFASILDLNWSTSINTVTMAQPIPINSSKELNLNKPNTFDGNRKGFKKFLQDVKVYMDINHETYNNDLRKITFILSFMMTGAAATWKAQFIEEAYTKPIPANPNDRLRMYATFKKELIEVFLMFDSVGDVLDKLQSLRKKKTNLIDKHIARFKMLTIKSKIDTTNPLSIKLFKETLPWALTVQLMKLETLLKTIDDWYKWTATLDHRHHKLNWAIEQTRRTSGKEKTPQRKYYFPRRERDSNAMDIDRLTVNKWNKLMKERRCFKCRNTGHRANKCPEDENNKKKANKEPWKKINGWKLYVHIWVLFKDMTDEDREEFLKNAEEVGF